MTAVRALVLPSIEKHGAIASWIIDDTGIPKKGKHSVGVARQYCGRVGKQENCQVAVSLSVANDFASLPIAYPLYLPRVWSDDSRHRRVAGVPRIFALPQNRSWLLSSSVSPALHPFRGASSSPTPPTETMRSFESRSLAWGSLT